MTLTVSVLRGSCAAIAAAGMLMISAGHAAAQQAYAGMPQPQVTYPAPPAYQAPAPVYQTYRTYQAPAYPPQAAYAPPTVTYPTQTQTVYPPAPAYQVSDRQITIIAPSVHRWTVGRTDSGIPVEEMAISRTVDTTDLNLTRGQDVQVLNDRIRAAAYSACNALNEEYPRDLYPAESSSDDDNCVVRATNGGMAQARAAIAQATGTVAYYPQ